MTLGALVDARIGALAGGRVFCAQAVEMPATPYIVWLPISDVPNTTHDAYRDQSTALVQVNVYAATAAEADEVRTEVVDAMCDGHDDAQAIDVGRMTFEDAISPNLFNAQADIEITYAP